MNYESWGKEIKKNEGIYNDLYCWQGNIWNDLNFYFLISFLFEGIVGEVDDTAKPPTYYIWTHKKLEIGYNGPQIVDVNLTSDNKVQLAEGPISFTYQVIWKKSNIHFKGRFDKYLDPSFFQHRVSGCFGYQDPLRTGRNWLRSFRQKRNFW